MSSFFTVISANKIYDEARHLFRFGMTLTHRMKGQRPTSTLEKDGVWVASYARQDGSGNPIVRDPERGTWLLAIGTWLHADAYGSGAEMQLLSRYREVGPLTLAQELEGFFVILIGDPVSRETFVITDLIGSCHCFVREGQKTVALSNSSFLLAALGTVALDPVGCQEFLYTGTIFEERTFYREVRKLRGATVFRFHEGGLVTEQPYWRATDLKPESLGQHDAVEAVWGSLVGAARKVGQLFPRPVCDLTGGYDSRTLLAAFLTADVKFSTTVSGPSDSPDVVIASELARQIGLSHLHIMPREGIPFSCIQKAFLLTDGEFNLIEYARILDVQQQLLPQFDVSINGSYGGIARALWWELLFPHIGACRPLDAQVLAKKRYAAQRADPSLFSPESRLDIVPHIASVIERINRDLTHLPNTFQMDYVNLLMRIQRWQGRIASSTNQLRPCLSIFGLRSVLEAVLQTKSRVRMRSLLIRHILTQYHPFLADFPLGQGCPASPVTLKNFYRFLPFLKTVGRAGVSKMRVRWRTKEGKSVSQSQADSTRIQLWGEETIQGLLNPDSMRLASLIDRAALAHFLDCSRQSSFSFDFQWERLVSLEYTLYALSQEQRNMADFPTGEKNL